MKILGTGLNGLVGSRLVELLSNKHQFENLSRSTGVDIINKEQVHTAIAKSDADVILHLAAKANVDACESDKELGESGEAWQINVLGTKNVVDACKEANKKIVFISTDFVFDGEKGNYIETDTTNPINWYAVTKAKGEEIVQASSLHWLILRIAFPFTFLGEKKHFVKAFFDRLAAGQQVKGVTDEIFTPTWIDDVATSLDVLLAKNEKGIFHIGGTESISPYDIVMKIADMYYFDKTLISQTTRADYFAGKAPRPFNTSLNNDRIKTFGVTLTPIEKALQKMKSQMSS